MDFNRFSDPAFWAAALGCVLILFQLGNRPGANVSPSKPVPSGEVVDTRLQLKRLQEALDAVQSRLVELESSIKSSGINDIRPQLQELQTATKAVESHLAGLDTNFTKLHQSIEPSADSQLLPDSTDFELHTKAEAEKLVADLGKTPTSEQLAECLSEIDGWVTTLEDADGFQEFKIRQISGLRQLVKVELADLQGKALNAESGSKAVEFHAKASRILALYPMDSSKAVLNEARTLSSSQADVGVRIEVIRRQRYNAWAMTRIEETIDKVNKLASSFSILDNPKIIDATIEHLGEVDPILLEPVISQFYTYAIEQAKTNVTSEQQLELGKRMIDPSIRRKSYGDF